MGSPGPFFILTTMCTFFRTYFTTNGFTRTVFRISYHMHFFVLATICTFFTTRTVSLISLYCHFLLFGLYCYFSRNFGVTLGFSWNLNRFEPVLGGLSLLNAMPLYSSMPMTRSNENNIIYSNNMNEKNKLLRELLSENNIEDLRTLVNFKRQMKKPKSTVKRMVDYYSKFSLRTKVLPLDAMRIGKRQFVEQLNI